MLFAWLHLPVFKSRSSQLPATSGLSEATASLSYACQSALGALCRSVLFPETL